MPPRPSAASTLRAGSYGAGSHSLPPRSGGMHVLTDGGGASSTLEPLAPCWSTTPSTPFRHDFTWNPSRGIIFHTPSTSRSRPTEGLRRKMSALPQIRLATWSATRLNSTAKVERVDSPGPLVQPLQKSETRSSLKAATGSNHKTDDPRPSIGLANNLVASTDLNGAQVESRPRHAETWKRWEPIFSDTTVAQTIVSKSTSDTDATEEKQSVAHVERRPQVTRDITRLSSNNLEESKQMMAACDGDELKRVQTMPQAKVERVVAHSKESLSSARDQQRATAAERPISLENTCESVDTEDCGIEDLYRPQTKPSVPTGFAESLGVDAHLSVRTRSKSQDARDKEAADIYSRKKEQDILYQEEPTLSKGSFYKRYILTNQGMRGNASGRKLLEEDEEWSAAETRLDETDPVAHRTELQTRKYRAYRAPFDKVKAGYFQLTNTLWDLRTDCPASETLRKYLSKEILHMQTEFLDEAHHYRVVARIGRGSDAEYKSGGLRWTYSSWQRRARHYYLSNPFIEQKHYTEQNLQVLWHINTKRRQLGLRTIHGGGRLRDDNEALQQAGWEFLACLQEREALGLGGIAKELNDKGGQISIVIRGLGRLVRDSRSLLSFWDRLPSSEGPAFSVRQNFYRCILRMHGHRGRFVGIARELEVAQDERIVTQPANPAVDQNSLLSEKTEAPTRSSQQSSRPHQQTLNLHATTPLNNAHFGATSLLQSGNSECLFDLTEQRSAASSDAAPRPSQYAFTFSEHLKKETLAASTSGNIYWQYNLYQGPAGEKVKVHYCRNKESSDRIAKLFLDKSVIGFDIEWKAQASAAEGTKKNVSLIQFASEERIALFHIARFGKDGNLDDLVPPSLKRIMETPEITKVGVAVKADCTRLRKFMGIEARGLLELSHLYKLIKFSSGDVKKINKSLVSLAQQVEEHLLLPMWKGDVRSSDWSEELNFQQIQYAASDSYAGLQLYHAMEAKRKAIEPTPPCPAHAELDLPIRLANGQTVATYNEPEEAEEETSPSEPVTTNDVLPEVEQMARDFLNLTIEDVRQNKTTSSVKPKRATKPIPTKTPEITAAEAWVAAWRTTLPGTYKAKASPAYLRAYAVWHDQGFGVQETASLLRDPPLQVTTVSNYILEAIRMEKLAYDAGRLKDVLGLLPESVAKNRYQSLRRQLE